MIGKSVFLHGYSSLEPQEILNALQIGKEITAISGDFVVYDPSPTNGFAISSFISALPYYYAISTKGELIQGGNVFEVARKAGIAWEWNIKTIQNLALYGHSLNNDTLCRGVYRIPPASHISIKNGHIVIKKLNLTPFEWDKEIDIGDTHAKLKESFADCLKGGKEVHLSLSAGYDSRLLLALCLDSGLTPIISVMGTEDCTDTVIAKEITKSLGLPIQVVSLNAQDYIKYGRQISYETSGVKVAHNWHTYLYGKGMDFSKGIHLVGSNGEFSRSFFFDYPRLNSIADFMPPLALKAYWFARLQRRLNKFSKHNPFFKYGQVILADSVGQCSVDKRWGANHFLPALDAFYAEQRVRHFIGSGLACYASYSSPRSPFLDAKWMKSTAYLSRNEKRNNLFHYKSIGKLNSKLNLFKFNSLPNGDAGKTFNVFPDVAKSKDLKELLLDSPYLIQWIEKTRLEALLLDTKCSQNEERAFWMTLHFASEALAKSS